MNKEDLRGKYVRINVYGKFAALRISIFNDDGSKVLLRDDTSDFQAWEDSEKLKTCGIFDTAEAAIRGAA